MSSLRFRLKRGGAWAHAIPMYVPNSQFVPPPTRGKKDGGASKTDLCTLKQLCEDTQNPIPAYAQQMLHDLVANVVDADCDELGWRTVKVVPPPQDALDRDWQASHRVLSQTNSMSLRFPAQVRDYRLLKTQELYSFGALGMILADCVYQKDSGGVMLEDSAAAHSQWNKVPCVPADFLKFCTDYVTLALTKSKEGGAAAGRYKTSSESLCIVFFGGFLQVSNLLQHSCNL